MTAKELINEYKSQDFSKSRHNSMGCSESWYNTYYAIYHTFSEDELLKMEEKEVDDLVRLADRMAEAFY